MYGVLNIEEPSGRPSILAGLRSATVMVCTVGSRQSLIEFRPTTPTGRGASGRSSSAPLDRLTPAWLLSQAAGSVEPPKLRMRNVANAIARNQVAGRRKQLSGIRHGTRFCSGRAAPGPVGSPPPVLRIHLDEHSLHP
jgi:hypothetical protein